MCSQDAHQLHATSEKPAEAPSGLDPALIINSVIPAKAGIHVDILRRIEKWIPAFAGMTILGIDDMGD
jgi:hypothetical protein